MLYERGCDDGLGYPCVLMGWLLTASRDPAELERGTAAMVRACELDQLYACAAAAAQIGEDPARADEAAAMRRKACEGGYAVSCDPGVVPSREPPERLPAPEAVCPGSFHWSTSNSGGPRVHSSLSQLEHTALLAATPTELPGYTTERRGSSPAGWAGTRTSSVWADYVADDRRVSVSIVDRAPDCTLQPGTGAAMLEQAIADGRGRPTEVAGAVAIVINTGPTSLTLSAWVADRCTVSITTTGLDQADLLELTATVDFTSLARVCAG